MEKYENDIQADKIQIKKYAWHCFDPETVEIMGPNKQRYCPPCWGSIDCINSGEVPCRACADEKARQTQSGAAEK